MIKQALKKIPGAAAAYRLSYRFSHGLLRRWQVRRQFLHLQKSVSEPRFDLSWAHRQLSLFDNTPTTHFDRHYLYHPAWAARILEKTRPQLHVDIASTLTFCSIISAFVPVNFYDYRPASLNLPNLNSEHADLTALHFADNSILSLSCMHVVEHIGLGRYGDPLDYDGDLKAISELKRVVAPGGTLLFVVPTGRPSIRFNSHRIYSYRQIRDLFASFELKQFALIPDSAKDGDLVIDADEALANQQWYGCGCFWFSKSTATEY